MLVNTGDSLPYSSPYTIPKLYVLWDFIDFNAPLVSPWLKSNLLSKLAVKEGITFELSLAIRSKFWT